MRLVNWTKAINESGGETESLWYRTHGKILSMQASYYHHWKFCVTSKSRPVIYLSVSCEQNTPCLTECWDRCAFAAVHPFACLTRLCSALCLDLGVQWQISACCLDDPILNTSISCSEFPIESDISITFSWPDGYLCYFPQASSIRALGVFVLYPCLKEDVLFLADTANKVLSAMTDQRLIVRMRAAWSLANISDSLVSNMWVLNKRVD